MTTTLVRPAPQPASSNRGNGGVPARRAIIRWAWRLYRREWRQQILVLLLLTFAVAVAVFGASAAYNVAQVSDAQFGSANTLVFIGGADPAQLRTALDKAATVFGTAETVGHRMVSIPGSIDRIDFRAQDPHGVYSRPTLRLRSGRYPTGPNDVAVTDGIARQLDAHVGGTLEAARRTWNVVGIVENPNDLNDEFALVPHDSADPPQSVTVFVRATGGQFDTFRHSLEGDFPQFGASTRGVDQKVVAQVVGLAVATVMLTLVALVAAAGFIVIAQRRQRQLGMLAAIGATERHLRLVVLANGAVVGAVAAVLGTVLGLAVRVVSAPLLESAFGHRIDRFDVPWLDVAGAAVLAVVAATGAAWWPARSVARMSITHALSARPARTTSVGRSAALAVVFLAIGAGCLKQAHEKTPGLIIGGTIAVVLGVLFLCPLAIRVLASGAGRLPVVPRLALRDLARHQGRSAAALAAISLALGIACSVAIAATPAPVKTGAGNLASSQLIVHLDDPDAPVADRTPAQMAAFTSAVDKLAAALGRPTVTPLDAVVDPLVPAAPPIVVGGGIPARKGGRPAVGLADSSASTLNRRDIEAVYAATPDVLAHFGIDAPASTVDALVTRDAKEWSFIGTPERGLVASTQTIHGKTASYASLPHAFMTPAAIERHGWTSVRTAWLIDAGKHLTRDQLASARATAAAAGLTIEARRVPPTNSGLRNGAVAVGALVALVVLALTLGLIRGEATAELRTLTATGATSSVRRALTATTAAALALSGVVLGILGAYIALASGYASHLDRLTNVPVAHLTLLLIGVPLLAAIGGWLLAGREPDSVRATPTA